MYTRGVRAQLVAFGVIAALSIGYLVLGYADGERTIGLSTYRLEADFRDTSGLYPRALVTYRGVEVGRVKSLDLSDDGVRVTLSLDSGTRIPVGARAEIHSTSAVGEQYVDLVPDRRGGPYLATGATIPRADTREMPQIAPVLDKLNGLLASVPTAPTERLLDQLDTALGSSAADVRELVSSSTDLVATAHAQVASTKQLLATVRPVLRSQTELGASTRSSLASLAGVSGELATRDPSLRSLLTHGAPALDSVGGLVDRLTPTFALLMANLVSSGEVLNTYVPQLKQVLVMYPAMIDRAQTTGLRQKAAGVDNLDVNLNLDDPPSCTAGYLPHSQWRDPSDTRQAPMPSGLHCAETTSSRVSVRGAHNNPCPNDAARRAADPAGCGLVFPGEQSVPYVAGRGAGRAGGAHRAGTGPEAIRFTLVTRAGTWRDLFTEPLR